MRPVDTVRGEFLLFECSAVRCHSITHVELPPIRKKIIYLDTSIVSSMARANARDQEDSPYLALYRALKKAVARNLIVCPGSTIVEAEAELMPKYTDIIIQMAKELGDPGLQHELMVKEAQIERALRRYLGDEEPVMEVELPESDALMGNVHAWHSVLFPVVHIATRPEFVDATRSGKAATTREMTGRFEKYARADVPFDQVADSESALVGCEFVREGLLIVQAKRAFLAGRLTDPRMRDVLLCMPTLSKLAAVIQHELGCSIEKGYTVAADFLTSEHVKFTPFAYITGKLNAELAMRYRGNARVNPRLPQRSDPFVVEHMATFVPYVDVFVADNFMATIANHGHVDVGDRFNTQIRSLPQADIPDFIEWLQALADEGDVAQISERIDAVIAEGGFYDDLVRSIDDRGHQ
jgi:hypothetical protein